MADHLTGGLLGLHALTALHPGAGTALGTVDLPVQRERHTHWPNIAGSALKGILRDACRERTRADKKLSRKDADFDPDVATLFGPPTEVTDEEKRHAGALSVTDARLLAFPVRSLKGVFAWVTCPEVLKRLQRDAAIVGPKPSFTIPDLKANEVAVADGSPLLIDKTQLVLEEFQFTKTVDLTGDLGTWVANHLLPTTDEYKATRDGFTKRFVVLNDDDFTHFARNATEVMARVGLNYDTKTVKDGALFYQEFLPTETLFYAVVIANQARGKNGGGSASELLKKLGGYLPKVLQVGGDETTGKGYCATRLFSANGGKS